MINLIANAIPFFLISVGIEAYALRHHSDEHDGDGEAAGPIGYERNDTRTSIVMGLGHLLTYSAWKFAMAAAYAAIYLVTPLRIDPGDWWAWILLFFCDDLAYYAYHRAHHRIRVFWASHVVHHSSEHYNLTTALRADWTPFTSIFFWAPLALVGFPPWMIFLAISWNLIYQFWIHTEKIGRLPRWYEAVLNCPSHHRVHHGSNEQYLDRNYAGVLIIWDRMFGTFEREGERVRYGLTTNIDSFNPVRVAFHEWAAVWNDVRGASSWRERLGYMFRGPGWRPGSDPPPAEAQSTSDSTLMRPESTAARRAA